ncbi:MAG: urea ABC transporter permease subunit UrtB, partial [Proteobacteria bacterium]|nr:urea ABC transporter permease subunit UrtB [Pseudomonadota bacterium]
MKRFLLALLLFALPVLSAWAAVDPALVKQLAAEDSDAKIAAIQKLGASGDRDAVKVLKALADDALMVTPAGRVFLMPEDKAFDAATGAEIDPAPEAYDAI